MKSSKKITLGQIEKGEELKKIDKKALDDEVVHKEGDETIYDKKTFKNPPKIDKDASSGDQAVRKSQMDAELNEKAEKGNTVNVTGDQDIDGVKHFKKQPTSEEPAESDEELIRKKELDEGLSDKVEKEDGKGLSTNDYDNDEKDKAKKGAKAYDYGLDDVAKNNPETSKKIKGDRVFSNLENEHFTQLSHLKKAGHKISFSKNSYKLKLEDKEGNTLHSVDLSSLQTGGLDVSIDDSDSENIQIVFTQGDEEVGRVSASDLLSGVATSGTLNSSGEIVFYDVNSNEAFRVNILDIVSGLAKEDDVVHIEGDETIKDEKTFKKAPKSEKDATDNEELIRKSQMDTELNKKVDAEKDKSLVDNELIEKIEDLDESELENIQSDFLELDEEHAAFIKNKQSFLHTYDEFVFREDDSQLFNLSCEMHQLISVEVNGQTLVRSQLNEWHNAIEILDELDEEDSVRMSYLTPSDYDRIHGFRFDVTVPAPEVERVGNPDFATELPIQSKMKGCLLKDSGEVNYWLKEDDWSKKEDGTDSDLTGEDGQVMVRVPRHWRKDVQKNDIRTILFSDQPFEGATEIPEMFVGAYKGAINRVDDLLCSVVNDSADYRGGNNQQDWDSENELKSQRGKPATKKGRTDFWDYAKNRGNDWYNILYQAHEAIAWLITFEFGTRNHQDAIDDGPVGVGSEKWKDFNGRYPIFKCGLTNSLGNSTGTKTVDLSDHDFAKDEVKVFRYRGIENWWGDIYEWMSGVNVIDNKYYVTGGKMERTDEEGYKLIGSRPTEGGYIEEMWPGTVLPKTNSGSSSTFYADYLYTNDTESVRGLLRSGHANLSAPAGSFLVYSSSAPSTTYASRGSRLLYVKR